MTQQRNHVLTSFLYLMENKGFREERLMLDFPKTRLAPYIIRLAFEADFVTVPLLSFYLKIQFGKWQKQGSIKYYNVNLRRIKKFYYELNLHVALKSTQSEELIGLLIEKAWEFAFR